MIQRLTQRLCHVIPILALTLGGVSNLSAQTIKVAVMGINSTVEWNQDVQHKLMSTGFFELVDTLPVSSVETIPTSSKMSHYDAILMYSATDLPTNAADRLGDALAAYFESGGGVVDMASLNTQGIPIGGRWRTAGYALLAPAPTVAGGHLSMGSFASVPLLRGVFPLDGGTSSFYSLGQPVDGTDVVAFWTNNAPLVILGSPRAHPRVTLNFFPVSSDARQDLWNAEVHPDRAAVPNAAQLMANALAAVTSAPSPGNCLFLIAPQNLTGAGQGFGGELAVTASHPNCQWTATSGVPWVHLPSGQASGSVDLGYAVDRNDGPARSATLHIANRDFVLNQAAGNPAAFTLSPTLTKAVSNQAFNGAITVTAANPALNWTAVSNAPWITITSTVPQSGNGIVSFSATRNSGPRRTGTLTVAGLTYVVIQGGAACSFTLNATAAFPAAAGDTARVTVSASSSGCPWTAVSESSFITITSAPAGPGDGVVHLSIAPNPSSRPRAGTVRIAMQTFLLGQTGTPATYSVNPASSSFPAAGGTGSIALSVTPSDAAWVVANDAPWITISAPTSGTGNANIHYSVAPNPGAQRTGTIAVGGQFVRVDQAARPADFSFTLLPLSAAFGAVGGNGTVTVTQTGRVALWSATSNAPWITIAAGATGNGNGMVSYAVAANPGQNTRSGSLTIAGSIFTVTQAGSAITGSRFVPVIPCRIADTRNPAGPYGGPMLAANSKRTFSITGAGCGIPVSAQAFSINITAVPNGPLGFLTAWPAGHARPPVSTLNSSDGRIVANAAFVPAGAGGAVDLFVTNDSHVVIDINGYFDAQNANALPFFPLTPCRIADTRNPAGPFGGPALAPNNPRSFNITAGSCSIPASAQAYSLNATVVPSAPLGFLTLWPSSQPQPLASTLNSLDGRVTANAAIVPSGSNGAVNAFATGTTGLVLDTNGYFGPTGNTAPLSFFPITPCRVADTRNPAGPFGGPSIAGGETRSFAIPQSSCGVPQNARAYSVNVTAVPHGVLQYLTLWPADQPQPLVSTLNSFQGVIVANAAIVPASADGSIKVFTSGASDVVIDINGYFASTQGPQNQPAFSLSVNPLGRIVTSGAPAN